MTFDDNDLKRLKEDYKDSDEIFLSLRFGKPERKISLNALLARLEAAEKALKASEYQEANPYFDAWRKAAGK